MKTQILAGTLGLVLLLSLIPMPSAEAKVFLIDDFSHDTLGFAPPTVGGGNCDETLGPGLNFGPFSNADNAVGDPGAPVLAGPVLGVLGDWRICDFIIDVPSGTTPASIMVLAHPNDTPPFPAFNMFRHSAGPFVETMVELTYNGTDGSLATDVIPFNIDLTDSDDIRIMYSRADFQVNVTARVTDSTGDWAEQEGFLAAGTAAITNLNYDIDKFSTNPSASNGAVDLTDIEEISFVFDTQQDLIDYVLEKIDITMQMVGGEMFPVDTTALLIAGAELNAIWILPAIAAIGIGAFVVTRKRNSS